MATTTTGRPGLELGELSRMGLAATLGAAAVASLVMAGTRGFDAGLLCLLATAALAATSLPVALRTRPSIVEPIWFVILAVAVGVTGKAFYVLLGRPERVEFLLRDLAPTDLVAAAWIVFAGLLLFALGYTVGDFRVRLPVPARLATDSWSERRLLWLSLALGIAGLVALVLFARQVTTTAVGWQIITGKRFVRVPGSEYPGSGGYLRWGASLPETAFYLVFAYWASRSKARRILTATVVVLGLLAVLFPVFSSSRRELAYVVFRMLIVWACIRGEPSPRLVAGAGAATLLLSSVMMAVRTGAQQSGAASRLGLTGLVDGTVASRHFLDLTKTAHVLDAFPQRFDYMHGESLIRWLIAPVPRSLWPAKPAVGIGKELGPPIFGTGPATGVPPGIIGELYLNFGLLGIFAGMVAAGALLRMLYVSLASAFPRKTAVLVYAVLVTHLAFGAVTMDLSGAMAKLLQDLIALLAAIWLVASPRGKP